MRWCSSGRTRIRWAHASSARWRASCASASSPRSFRWPRKSFDGHGTSRVGGHLAMAGSHVRRGDTVGVIAGKERGKRGKVLRVVPEKGRVLVEHVNMIKKHQRPTQKLRQGGIIEREGPLALSNVLVVCPRCDKPARTGIKILTDGRKVRTCRRCGESIDRG